MTLLMTSVLNLLCVCVSRNGQGLRQDGQRNTHVDAVLVLERSHLSTGPPEPRHHLLLLTAVCHQELGDPDLDLLVANRPPF